MSFTLRIDVRDFSAEQRAALSTVLEDKLALDRAAVEGASPLYQRRFVELAQSNTNPFGVGSSFWRRMLSSTKSGADATGGFIRMPREVALRAFGGVVKPKRSKFLAIAARTEAYGKSPRQFNDLRFVPRRGRPGGMLIQNDQTRVTRYSKGAKKGQVKERREVGGLVMYWLVPQATIQGSDAVLPVSADVGAAAMRGVQTLIGVRMKREAR